MGILPEGQSCQSSTENTADKVKHCQILSPLKQIQLKHTRKTVIIDQTKIFVPCEELEKKAEVDQSVRSLVCLAVVIHVALLEIPFADRF